MKGFNKVAKFLFSFNLFLSISEAILSPNKEETVSILEQRQSQALPSIPSGDLLPPPRLQQQSGGVVQVQGQPPPVSITTNENTGSGRTVIINGETLELLPPLEIPPERPIDNTNGNNGFQSSGSSLISTTGPGTNGQTFQGFNNNPGQINQFSQAGDFTLSPPTFQGPSPSINFPGPGSDPGQDCLGTCDCPGDFKFVCGSNRFLYQNDCALECDKKCHPEVVKVDIAHCSRRRRKSVL